MPDPGIFWKNIKTIYTYKNPNTDYPGYELRIGRWVVGGRDREIVLARQEFKETVSGQILWGKIKGLTAGDMYRIFDKAPLISDLMSFPLPIGFSKQRELADLEVRTETGA